MNQLLKLSTGIILAAIFILLASFLFSSSLPLGPSLRNEIQVMSFVQVNYSSPPVTNFTAPMLKESNATLEVILHSDVVFEIPSNPRGVVFFAHGCTHKATQFWDFGPNCIDCSSLPEDKKLTREFLNHGYAVVAISSENICWDVNWPAEKSLEAVKVSNVLKEWRTLHDLTSVPIHALGASSGGYFVSILAHLVEFQSLVIMISGGVSMAFEAKPSSGKPFPPTLFVHMPKDTDTQYGVQKAMKSLRGSSVEAAELHCKEIPLYPAFLANRIEGFPADISQELFRLLNASNSLTKAGFLKLDGRQIEWMKLFHGKKVIPDSLFPDRLKAMIEEELNVAYAAHELTSENSTEILHWFDGVCESHGKLEPHRCAEYS